MIDETAITGDESVPSTDETDKKIKKFTTDLA